MASGKSKSSYQSEFDMIADDSAYNNEETEILENRQIGAVTADSRLGGSRIVILSSGRKIQV